MRKSFLIFMFCTSSELIISSGYAPGGGSNSQSSVLSNHGWDADHDSKSSQVSFASLDRISYVVPSVFRSSAQVASSASSASSASVKLAWDSSDIYPHKTDGFVDLAKADRIQVSWLAHLDDESLQKKCTLIQEQDARYSSIIDSEFLDEFARRHPESLDKALAGSKRRRSFSREEVDTLCEGDVYDSEGLFEKFNTRDLDVCLASLNARNEELRHYLLVTFAPKADFKRVVAEQVEINRMCAMLCYKKLINSGQDDEDFVGDDTGKELQQKNLITKHFPRSLVPYPVWPVKFPDSSKKSVELK